MKTIKYINNGEIELTPSILSNYRQTVDKLWIYPRNEGGYYVGLMPDHDGIEHYGIVGNSLLTALYVTNSIGGETVRQISLCEAFNRLDAL